MYAQTVFPVVYCLELEGDESNESYFYVGACIDFNKRVTQHIEKDAANFTKLHDFKRVVEVRVVHEGNALIKEQEMVLEYMEKYSAHRVRGGKFTRC